MFHSSPRSPSDTLVRWTAAIYVVLNAAAVGLVVSEAVSTLNAFFNAYLHMLVLAHV
jgi:hypothetical protein